MGLSFHGNQIEVDGHAWSTEYPIQDAKLIGDKVIVIYDRMAGVKFHQMRNLEAFDRQGRKLWTAEHPTNETADCYVNFMDISPLTVWNFACFICVIDPENGKLVNVTFTK